MISRLTIRTFVVILAVAIVAGVQAMAGQTAPQLLPYQMSVVAGGGPTYTFAANGPCPVSKNTSTDIYGDGCLATEVTLNAPKYVTEDSNGNIYFSDYGNALIRKVNGPNTANPGVITAVAGAATTTATGCDFQGDGCLATQVQLLKPTGVAIAPPASSGVVSPGDILFADAGTHTVRGINSAGLLYNVAGDVQGSSPTPGYIVNTSSTNIVANTQSALYSPYGIHFDAAGNLYIAEEYKAAVLVVNTSAVPTTIGPANTGITVQPGTIAKLVGFPKTGGGAYCPNGTTGTYGCYGDPWPGNTLASLSAIWYPYDVTADQAGNVYVINEDNAAVGQVSNATFDLNTYAGTQTSVAVTIQRASSATAIPFGTPYGVAADSYGNIYIPDSFTGWVWRVDAAGHNMYVLAGNATAVCSASVDLYGDGCPTSGTMLPQGQITPGKLYASSPGISGLFVDASGTLLMGDTAKNLVHQITTNANFGTIQPTNPQQTIQIHFGVGDGPGTYAVTTNPENFTLGTSSCTNNTADNTTDCLLPVTANPPFSAAGPGGFSGNLQVVSQQGQTGNFTLSGVLTLSQLPSTTAVKLSSNSTNPVAPVTITATVSSATSNVATGTVTFLSNGVPIGTTQTLTNGAASIQYVFPLGSYSITAEYDGSFLLTPSTSTPVTVTSVTPGFSITPLSGSLSVAQGQTAMNSFTVSASGGYAGTVTFACSGLPANASCSFSPAASGNSSEGSVTIGQSGVTSAVVTLNVITGANTSQASLAKPVVPGTGRKLLPLYCLLPCATGLLLFGTRRGRKSRLAAVLLAGTVLGVIGFTGCAGNQAKTTPTPAGSYTIMVTATGTPNVVSTSNIVQTSNITLTVSGY